MGRTRKCPCFFLKINKLATLRPNPGRLSGPPGARAERWKSHVDVIPAAIEIVLTQIKPRFVRAIEQLSGAPEKVEYNVWTRYEKIAISRSRGEIETTATYQFFGW